MTTSTWTGREVLGQDEKYLDRTRSTWTGLRQDFDRTRSTWTGREVLGQNLDRTWTGREVLGQDEKYLDRTWTGLGQDEKYLDRTRSSVFITVFRLYFLDTLKIQRKGK